MPIFSIGITTFDRRAMLIEAINSVLQQTYADFEVIISNDNPARKITADSLKIWDTRVRIINQEKNLGEFNNMNYLLNESKGEYFTWLADDDLYNNYFLETAHNILKKHNWPQCFYTSFGYVGNEDITAKHDLGELSLPGPEFLNKYLGRQLKAIGVMGIFKREALINLGGLEDVSGDGKGFYCEYMLLIKASKFPVVQYVNAPLVLYRHHADAWGVKSTDVAMFYRAAKSLNKISVAVLLEDNYKTGFYKNYYAILKLITGDCVSAMRRKKILSLRSFVVYLYETRKYLSSLKGWACFKGTLAWLKAIIRLFLRESWYIIKGY